jgi:hypothetical protein
LECFRLEVIEPTGKQHPDSTRCLKVPKVPKPKIIEPKKLTTKLEEYKQEVPSQRFTNPLLNGSET